MADENKWSDRDRDWRDDRSWEGRDRGRSGYSGSSSSSGGDFGRGGYGNRGYQTGGGGSADERWRQMHRDRRHEGPAGYNDSGPVQGGWEFGDEAQGGTRGQGYERYGYGRSATQDRPFHSMLVDAAHRSLPHKIVLIFSNRTPKDAPFLSELNDLAGKNPNLTFVPTMTDMDTSSEPWEGEKGQITPELVKSHMPEGEPIFYLAGPAGMVKAMRELLTSIGISSDDIRTEEFTGY